MQPINGNIPPSSQNADKSTQTEGTTKKEVHGRTFEVVKDKSNWIESIKKFFLSIGEAFSNLTRKIFSASKKENGDEDIQDLTHIFPNFKRSNSSETIPSKAKEPAQNPQVTNPSVVAQEVEKERPEVGEAIPVTETPSSPQPRTAVINQQMPPQEVLYKSGLERVRNKNQLGSIPNFAQVMVMNQTQHGQAAGAFVCGMHSFKNAVIGLGIDKGIEGFSADDFNSTQNFNEFYAFARKFSPQEDISISNLALVQKALVNAKTEDLTPFLRKMQKVLKEYPNSITMLNPMAIGDYEILPSWDMPGIQSEREVFTGGLDFASLHFLSNLKDVVDKPGPLTHSFLVGSTAHTGHWLSFTLHKDKEGNYHWFGYDSYNNQTIEFKKRIEILNKMIGNPDFYMKEGYQLSLGGDFKNNADRISQRGDLRQDVSYAFAIKFKKSKEVMLESIKSAYNFMEKLGWFQSNDPEIQIHVAQLKKVAEFYRREALKEAILKPGISADIEPFKTQNKEKIILEIVDVYFDLPEEAMKALIEDLYNDAFKKAPERSKARNRIDNQKKAARNVTGENNLKNEMINALNHLNLSKNELIDKLNDALFESEKVQLFNVAENDLRALIPANASLYNDPTFQILNKLV